MKLIIRKEALLDNLQKVLGPSTTKQNFPILNSILISTIDTRIKFITTDLDITIISLQEAEIITSGIVAVPMKRFISIIRELPPHKITLEKNKNNLFIRCENIEFKINTLNHEEFPKIQEEKGVSLVKIDPHKLEEMIRLTSFCVGYEDVNYILNGILFEINENKITLVATDGKRLSFIQKTLPSNQPEVKTKISFILPIKAITELYKLIKEKEEDIYLSTEENKIGFDFKDTQFIARPIEGEFIDYSQYIPKESKDKLVINRKELLFSLRRANILSTSEHLGVKLELKKNSVIVYKNTPQLGEVKEVIDALYSGAHLELGFNPNYITDVLKNLEEDEVAIEFLGADKPAVVKKEGYICLLLPMKL